MRLKRTKRPDMLFGDGQLVHIRAITPPDDATQMPSLLSTGPAFININRVQWCRMIPGIYAEHLPYSTAQRRRALAGRALPLFALRLVVARQPAAA